MSAETEVAPKSRLRRIKDAVDGAVASLVMLGLVWYVLALFLPVFGYVQPLLGINQWGTGTAYALPLIPRSWSPVAGETAPAAARAEKPVAAPVIDADSTPAAQDLRAMSTVSVTLRFVDKPCGLSVPVMGTSGCVSSTEPTTIYLSTGAASQDAETVRPLVAHELGHVYQGLIAPDFLMSNTAVNRAFPKRADAPSHEQLADCMAMYRSGHTTGSYLQTCTPTQLHIAAEVWAGVTPGS